MSVDICPCFISYLDSGKLSERSTVLHCRHTNFIWSDDEHDTGGVQWNYFPLTFPQKVMVHMDCWN